MGYHVVDPADIEPMEGRSAEARSISEAVGMERRNAKLGMRLYDADPGEQLPLFYHYHEEQVEAFYVLDGTLHIETPEDEFVVESGQTFVVDPGNPHRAYNPETADGRVRVFAVGAPSVDDGQQYDPDE